MIKTIFNKALSDEIDWGQGISNEKAEKLFNFFKNHGLFRWTDANNDCEDRANAICILLDEWKIPNCKAWVFSGYVFNKIGYLHNLWKYHVAAAVPVMDGSQVRLLVIDPATATTLINIESWAANVTDNPHSYYLIKKGSTYIFSSKKIEKDNWYKRNRRNYNWTLQGLSGINGISVKGKAQLRFNKRKIEKTKIIFRNLKNSTPDNNFVKVVDN